MSAKSSTRSLQSGHLNSYTGMSGDVLRVSDLLRVTSPPVTDVTVRQYDRCQHAEERDERRLLLR